jgi:hypothetical protein
METNWERVSELDDPRRCQAVVQAHGQCMNVAVEGCTTCLAHGGAAQNKLIEKSKVRMYNLGRWRAQANEFQDHDKIKSLREEIGILRVMIDERMKMCKSETDLALYSGPLTVMIMNVEKLVTSCNKLEMHLSGILDKTQALQLGQEMVEIIGRHLDSVPDKDLLISKISSAIDDPSVLDAISEALADCRSKDDVLEGISNDIVETVERLGKSG